jgi:hypothetical protein
MRIQVNGFLRVTLTTSIFLLLLLNHSSAQVNMVEFGKNRVQHTKFKWSFYQSPNFNVHYNLNGLELAKFATQVAEAELPLLEDFIEFGSW